MRQTKIKTEAKFPNNAQVLKRDFNLNDEQLKKLFILPHTVSFELNLSFPVQCKVLNSISFPNTKLFKIGFVTEDKCSFCKSQSETLSHLLFDCIKTSFWRDFEFYFYCLSKEFVHLTLKDVIVGIIITKCPLLNYLWLRYIYGIAEELKYYQI